MQEIEMENVIRKKRLPGYRYPGAKRHANQRENSYTVKELPQPQVLLTFGLLNLKPEPSSDSM